MTLMHTHQPTSPSLLSSFYFTFSLVGMFYFYHVCPCDTDTTLSGIRRISPLHSIPYTCGPVGYDVRHILHNPSHEYACLIQFLAHQSHTQIFGKGKKKKRQRKSKKNCPDSNIDYSTTTAYAHYSSPKQPKQYSDISLSPFTPTHSTQNLSSTVTLSIFKANSNLQIPSDKKLYICN